MEQFHGSKYYAIILSHSQVLRDDSASDLSNMAFSCCLTSMSGCGSHLLLAWVGGIVLSQFLVVAYPFSVLFYCGCELIDVGGPLFQCSK